MFDVEYGLFDK